MRTDRGTEPAARLSLMACLAVALAMAPCAAVGQVPSLRELLAPDGGTTPAATATVTPQRAAAPETYGERGTPRASVSGFLAAAQAGDWERAASFLDPGRAAAPDAALAARQLREVLARQVWIEPTALSDAAEGYADDGLPADRDSVGWIEGADGPRQIVVQRLRRDGAQVWLFSSASVAAARETYEALDYGRLTAMLPPPLRDYHLFGIPLWQWIALIGLVLVAYLVALLVTRLGLALLGPLARRTRTQIDDRLLALAGGPARLLVAVAVFSAGRLPLGLPVALTAVLAAVEQALVVVAATWIVLRLLDVIAELLRERLLQRGQVSATGLVAPGMRTAKVFVVILALVAALDNFGFNVTALLAGLGVGGIAVALAAQKSVENLFGGVTLYADQPVRVGDFCRFGDTVGTVEDIGLRSTRIRTLERTVVSVPNAEFANLHLENFSRRDKFWYHPTVGLRYETTPDQLRYILVEVRKMLYAHPKVDNVPARIRFTRFGAYSLDLEIFAYVRAADFDRFLEVQEDLHLRLMDIVAAAGSSFAFPSQTTYLESGAPLSDDRRREIEGAVAGWRERDALYLPDLPAERIAELDGSLDYPPAGTPAAARDGRRAQR